MFSNISLALRNVQLGRKHLALFLLALALCAGLVSYTGADGLPGQWLQAPFNTLGCSSNLRCAEWCVFTNDNGWEPLYTCCISPVSDPTDPAACQGLRQIE